MQPLSDFRAAFLAALINAIFIGITLLSTAWNGQQTYVLDDSASYYEPGLRLVTDNAFSSQLDAPFYWEDARTPGYPFLIGLLASYIGVANFYWVLLLSPVLAGLLLYYMLGLAALLQLPSNTKSFIIWCTAFFPNALGFSGLILTEYIGAVLALIALVLTLKATLDKSWRLGILAATMWACCQFTRPTFTYILLYLIVITVFLVRDRRQLQILLSIGLISLFTPALLAFRMHQTHGVYTISTIGAHTTREYLLAKTEARHYGFDYLTHRSQVQGSIEAQALETAAKTGITLEQARYTLVTQDTRAVISALGIGPIARVYLEELARQFLAPWDFIYWPLFGTAPPQALRIALIPLSLLFYALAGWGLFKQQNNQARLIGSLLWIYFCFWLTTGALSTGVGSRLKFPGDLALIPLAAMGFTSLRHKLSTLQSEK